MSSKRYHIFLLSFLLLLNLQCSSSTKYRVLSFFFDGVENPEQTNLVAADSSGQVVNQDAGTNESRRSSEPQYYYHAIYQERACDACHNAEQSNMLIEQVPDLCYQCHENFSETYAYLHAPVEGGECLTCHKPHFATNKDLLVQTGQQLCFDCHDQEELMAGETHSEIGETNCTECHNPHGGEDETLFN